WISGLLNHLDRIGLQQDPYNHLSRSGYIGRKRSDYTCQTIPLFNTCIEALPEKLPNDSQHKQCPILSIDSQFVLDARTAATARNTSFSAAAIANTVADAGISNAF
ncbi:hypothetical protein C8J56DRAFT_1160163, partial [Mycena floridula]